MKPKFSISLIVKNAEKTLPRLLDSLKEFRDRGGEICIIDTGSDATMEGTINLCRRIGVNFQFEKFNRVITSDEAEMINSEFLVGDEQPIVKAGDKYFNFSEARNYADSLASNDWILSLDADEVVTNLDIDQINTLISDGVAMKFEHIQIFTHDRNGNEEIKFYQSKFYDRKFIKWDNIVHEMLTPHKKMVRLNEKTLRIDHYQNQESNRAIYLTGLAMDAFFHPEKDRICHYFARELFLNNRPKSAIKQFERHLAMKLPEKDFATTPTHYDSMMYLGNAIGQLGDIDAEWKWYREAMEEDPTHRNVVVRMGRYYQWHKNKDATKMYCDLAKKYPFDEKYGVSESHFMDEIDEMLEWAKEDKIPKRIISIWLGGEMPSLIKDCILTHYRIPGYEWLMITNNNYEHSPYVDECIAAGRYAKAVDYLRMYYLEKYGGIYLDSDVKVLKPFDDLLSNDMFVCEEGSNGFIANSIVGSIAHHPALIEYLRVVESNFKGSGDLVFQPGMQTWTDTLKMKKFDKGFTTYAQEFFLPYNWQTGETKVTENTRTFHYYIQSWKK